MRFVGMEVVGDVRADNVPEDSRCSGAAAERADGAVEAEPSRLTVGVDGCDGTVCWRATVSRKLSVRNHVSSSFGMAGIYECEAPPVASLPAAVAPVARARLGVFSTAEKREVLEAAAVLDTATALDRGVAARGACRNGQQMQSQ